MPAKIVALSGEAAGHEFWIEQEVVRLGSGPNCDIQLDDPEVEPHALTLEFVAGRYTVYNRSSAEIALGGRAVAPGGSGHWRSGTELFMGTDLALQLVAEADPTPVPMEPEPPLIEDDFAPPPPTVAVESDADDVSTQAAGSDSGSGKLVQLLVILVCIGAIVGLLVTQGGTKPKDGAGRDAGAQSGQEPPLSYEELIEHIDTELPGIAAQSPQLAADLRALRESVRAAQAARRRGDIDGAWEHYIAIRDRILLMRRDLGRTSTAVSPAVNELYRFVTSELEAIAAEP